jgi:hypothetical protein
METEGHSSSPGPIFYTEERERERERVIRREGGRSGEDEAWEDHLRSQLLEQTTYDGSPRNADLATSPPLGSQPAVRVGSAGGVSVGSVLSQLDRSGRLATSRRGSGVLLIPPGVPLSSAVAIAARLQQGQEGQEEKEDGGDLDGGDQDLGEIGRQFRSLMLQDEEGKGNHFNDDYRFNLSNNTGGTMSPVEGIFEGDHFYLDDSLRASLDYSVKSSEGKRDRDCSHDTTPQIVQREGRALRESLEAESEGDELEEKEDERVKERETEREREAQRRGQKDYTGDAGMMGLGIAGIERKGTGSFEGMVGIGGRGGDVGDSGDRGQRGGGGGGGGGGAEDSENAGFKIPLNTSSFDSMLGGGSDHSNSNEDIQSLVDIDCNNDTSDDLEGPDNVELQQAILRSIIDSGDDPRSGSHYRTEDAYVSLPRLKSILVDLALNSSEALDMMQRTYDRTYGPYSAGQDDDKIAPGKSVKGKGSDDTYEKEKEKETGGLKREKGEKVLEREREKERERRLSIDSFALPSSTSLCARASFSIWQKVQGVISKGLEALYSVSERRALVLDIIHSPSTMKHVLCGVCTALHCPSNKSQKNMFHTLSHRKRDVTSNTPLFYQHSTSHSTFADDDFESISVPEIINFIKHIRAGHLSDKVVQIFPRKVLQNFGPEDGIYPKQSPFGTNILFYEGSFLRSITAYSLFRFLRSILAPALVGYEVIAQEGKEGKEGKVSPADNLNLNMAGSDYEKVVLNLLVDCLLIDLKAIFNSEMYYPPPNTAATSTSNSASRSGSTANIDYTSDGSKRTHAECNKDVKSALNCTFSGTVLPFLAVRYTQNEKIKSIEIFLPHAFSLLKLFHGFTSITNNHGKSSSSESGSRSRVVLIQWLENKIKWVRIDFSFYVPFFLFLF